MHDSKTISSVSESEIHGKQTKNQPGVTFTRDSPHSVEEGTTISDILSPSKTKRNFEKSSDSYYPG